MKVHRFIAEASVICDRCGQMVKAGEAAVAEFYPRDEKCRIRHENCPTTTPSRPNRRNPIRPIRNRAARIRKTHNEKQKVG